MHDAAILWRSAKQTLIATSTIEAEFISYFMASSQGLWLRNFITELKIVDLIRPIKVYYDNTTAIFFTKNNKNKSRSKHIDINYLALIEDVKANVVIIIEKYSNKCNASWFFY